MPHKLKNDSLDHSDFLTVVVSREEVKSGNIGPVSQVLGQVLVNSETAAKFCERVDIAFHGYDSHVEELFEITEVRNFVYELDNEFPYWLYFLSKHSTGLMCILLCFLPPYLTDEAKAKIFPQRLSEYLTRRGFPAMNHVCEYAQFTEKQIEALTERVMTYLESGCLLK